MMPVDSHTGRPNSPAPSSAGRKLSPTMQECVRYVREHGGIHRHPGGFWAHAAWRLHSGGWFDTSTVHALVKRGVLQYVEWQSGRNGQFPITAKITEAT